MFFFEVYGGNSFPTKKPDPLGARQLMAQAGCRPEETLLIGDSSNDILTARNAGLWELGRHLRLRPAHAGLRAARRVGGQPGGIERSV